MPDLAATALSDQAAAAARHAAAIVRARGRPAVRMSPSRWITAQVGALSADMALARRQMRRIVRGLEPALGTRPALALVAGQLVQRRALRRCPSWLQRVSAESVSAPSRTAAVGPAGMNPCRQALSACLRSVTDRFGLRRRMILVPAGDAAAGGQAWPVPGGLAGGADEVVTRLYRDNGAFVLSYVTGLLRDRYLAEDVVQETMLRAWRHCGSFSAERGSVRGWLVRVAHNIAMGRLRMRRSRPAEVAADAAPGGLVPDHAEAVVTAVQVRAALARLSGGQREVVEQVYLNGLTAREAAVRLGIPEGTVFSRCYYALRALRRELGAADPGAGAAEPGAGAPGCRAA